MGFHSSSHGKICSFRTRSNERLKRVQPFMPQPQTPRFGVHTSIAGGLPNSVKQAMEIGCDGFQIFARNPRGWSERPLLAEEIRAFKVARARAGLWPLAIHSVYLINL